MSHVRRHASQISQPVLPGQLAILLLQFVGKARHLGLQRFVRLLEPSRRVVPRRQDRRECGLLLGEQTTGPAVGGDRFVGLDLFGVNSHEFF